MPAMPVALIGSVRRILGLIRLPQHVLDFVHEDEELRIEMPHQRRRHDAQDSRMHVARTGAQQDTGRGIELTRQ